MGGVPPIILTYVPDSGPEKAPKLNHFQDFRRRCNPEVGFCRPWGPVTHHRHACRCCGILGGAFHRWLVCRPPTQIKQDPSQSESIQANYLNFVLPKQISKHTRHPETKVYVVGFVNSTNKKFRYLKNFRFGGHSWPTTLRIV